MKKPFEIEALKRAKKALEECAATLKACQVSVTTDYACGEAKSRVNDALANIERELAMD